MRFHKGIPSHGHPPSEKCIDNASLWGQFCCNKVLDIPGGNDELERKGVNSLILVFALAIRNI